LFLLARLHADAHGYIGDSRVHGDFLELTLSLDDFLVFYRRFCFTGTDEGVMLLWLFPQNIYIFVAWRETLLNVSGILLSAKD
jgi:hypothetical protein